MGAMLRDLSVTDDQNLVGVLDGIQTVGNDQQGLTLYQFGDSLLNIALIVSVHAGGRLVQNYNGSVFQNTAGDGDTLFLTAGEGCAALSHHSLKSVRQSHDEIVAAGFPRRLIDLLLGGVLPILMLL